MGRPRSKNFRYQMDKKINKLAATTGNKVEMQARKLRVGETGSIEDRSGTERLKTSSNGGLKRRATSRSLWSQLCLKF
ncbi:hypothetical protein PoB_003863000 [Plakobranchus ocellatus]|uniref:Uncharacterized protein n=1 Tax=Plakobranchus ocellatus TaxID=259542 RepID=A0AAV4AXX8_9GAST|nr:hypothetical protein PoB_003863000 [Plakobranchus ocellatus]